MKEEIGVVISTFEGPSPGELSFVIKSEEIVPVRKDQFVCIEAEDGELIARVTNIRKTNRYYGRPESVREYETNSSMNQLFPIDSWEFLIADAIALGVYSAGGILRPTFPASPGAKVRRVEPDVLGKFLGFEKGGIALGTVEHHNLAAEVSLDRLIHKHLAILALSGAGKSYTVSVLIEELLDRKKGEGRPAVIVMDTHGEYVSFADPGLYQDRINVINAADIKIPVHEMTAGDFAELSPGISGAQRRELHKVLSGLWVSMRSGGNTYDLKDVISAVEAADMNDNIKQALQSWLVELDSTRLFHATASPSLKTLLEPGKAVIVDLSEVVGLRNKQVIVTYLTKKLFKLRREGKVPPYVEVIEEAHNFVPERMKKEVALSRHVLETVAREGRKFYASLCLVSQRPIQLSTTILSQCNTHIILRVMNPYDLDHIGQSSEGITKETLKSITTLRVGEALIVGEAVNHPVFVKVRQRRSPQSRHSLAFEEAAKRFEASEDRKAADAAAFL